MIWLGPHGGLHYHTPTLLERIWNRVRSALTGSAPDLAFAG